MHKALTKLTIILYYIVRSLTRECVIEKRVVLHFVPTTEQIADIMTKCLSYDKFKKFRNLLGITIS